jgi:hypothetical protein
MLLLQVIEFFFFVVVLVFHVDGVAVGIGILLRHFQLECDDDVSARESEKKCVKE